jgi:hypothetical protein
MSTYKMPEGLGYPDLPGERIKVRATQMGEYEYARRRDGDVFTLKPREVTVVDPITRKPIIEHGKPKMRILTAEEQFSSRWMERIDEGAEDTITTAQAALNNATEEINEGRRPGRPRKEVAL